MDEFVGGDDFEDALFGGSQFRFEARMEQMPGGKGHESVGVEEILFEVQRRVTFFEISGAVGFDAVAQDEILRAGGRADGVGLDEA